MLSVVIIVIKQQTLIDKDSLSILTLLVVYYRK